MQWGLAVMLLVFYCQSKFVTFSRHKNNYIYNGLLTSKKYQYSLSRPDFSLRCNRLFYHIFNYLNNIANNVSVNKALHTGGSKFIIRRGFHYSYYA